MFRGPTDIERAAFPFSCALRAARSLRADGLSPIVLALVVVLAVTGGCSRGRGAADAQGALATRGAEGEQAALDDARADTASGGGFAVAPEFRWADSRPEATPDASRRSAPRRGAEPPSMISPALEHGAFGLYPAREFRIPPIDCRDCGPPAAALWYFRDELIAVPRASADGDADARADAGAELPPLVWLGAPEVVDGATVANDGTALVKDGAELPLQIAAPLPSNTAYADRSTLRFFAGRSVRARGITRVENGRAVFVARTLWPSDARIDARRLDPRPLRRNELIATLIEAEWGGRTEDRFPARLLFERRGAPRDWAGKAVLAFVLSGAQGDDDGSRVGHLAIATGRFGANGEWRDWLVNDFYPLDDPSPKGILSAPVPIDDYLFDFNSGQLYYRPAYMLVAVLGDAGLAVSVQTALQQTMLRYYCRAFDFDLARHNSTALGIDSLRALGWRIPETGPTSVLAALLAAPLVALGERSVTSGEQLYAALTQEKTRLLPRVAFEALGEDLLTLVAQGGRPGDAATELERRLAADVDAVLFVRLPQVPSSRRVGTFPERSLLVYAARLLSDPGPYERPEKLEAVPFPAELAGSCNASSL